LYALNELRWWRERQLNEYQHAQIINRLDKQRLLEEYQRAQAIDRLDQQNKDLSQLGSILADTSTNIGLIQGDIARLLAVTDKAVLVIIDHLELVRVRLAEIEQMLASPRETEAWELFRSGFRALTSANEMSNKGSQGLADDWLDEAINDLSRAVDIYRYRPEFWFHLGLAYACRGPSEEVAEAFSRCARYAISASPRLAAQSVLLAAGQFRSVGEQARARDLLHEFLPPLERCAEIHLNLAKYHGESDRLTRALELAPLLAAVARAEGVASVEEAAADVCRLDDGPVSRLQALQEALRALSQAARRVHLKCGNKSMLLIALPDFGVDALLIAEVNIPLLAERANQFATDVRAELEQLETHAQDCRQRCQQVRASAAAQANRAQEEAAQAKKRAREEFEAPLATALREEASARHAYKAAGEELRRMTLNSRAPREVLDAYIHIFDESGKFWPDVLARLRELWKMPGETWISCGDEALDAFRLYHWYTSRLGPSLACAEMEAWAKRQPPGTWPVSWEHVNFAELALCMLAESGKLQADVKPTTESINEAMMHLQTADSSLKHCAEIVEQARKQQASDTARENLRNSQLAADRIHQDVLNRIEEDVRRLEIKYSFALDASRDAKAAISGYLDALQTMVRRSVASRDRIIPTS
jgi:hypothetical protein